MTLGTPSSVFRSLRMAVAYLVNETLALDFIHTLATTMPFLWRARTVLRNRGPPRAFSKVRSASSGVSMALGPAGKVVRE